MNTKQIQEYAITVALVAVVVVVMFNLDITRAWLKVGPKEESE